MTCAARSVIVLHAVNFCAGRRIGSQTSAMSGNGIVTVGRRDDSPPGRRSVFRLCAADHAVVNRRRRISVWRRRRTRPSAEIPFKRPSGDSIVFPVPRVRRFSGRFWPPRDCGHASEFRFKRPISVLWYLLYYIVLAAVDVRAQRVCRKSADRSRKEIPHGTHNSIFSQEKQKCLLPFYDYTQQ